MIAPKLRFSSFKKSWESNKLELVMDSIQSGKSKEREIDGQFPLFGSTGAIGYTNNPEYSGAAILIARVGANAGSKYAVDGEYSVTDNTLILRLKDGCSYEFFSDLLEYKKLNKLTFGSGQPLVTGSLLKQLEVSYPEENEQQKVASFLSKIDQKISLLSKKHELLVQYKKGVMQKIFNREISFKDKDGKDFPRWQPSTIDSIATKKASTISANKIKGNFGEYKIYGASGVLKTVDFYTEEGEYVSIVKDGAGAGRAFLCEPKTSVLGTMEKVIANDGISTKFLYELLNSIDFSQFITGSTIPHVYFKDYGKSQIKLPCFDEQIKISNFLMKIDKAVEIAKSQIKLTEQYKQGLLQQMFI